MPTGQEYKTRQKAQLSAFLESARGEHLTAKDVQERLAEQGVQLGTATIYRQLERLVNDGVVRKYTLGTGNGACFEYVGESACEVEHCFHCICSTCGRLIHVECEQLAQIAGHMMQHHHFAIDPLRTVFYGTCENCAGVQTQD